MTLQEGARGFNIFWGFLSSFLPSLSASSYYEHLCSKNALGWIGELTLDFRLMRDHQGADVFSTEPREDWSGLSCPVSMRSGQIQE